MKHHCGDQIEGNQCKTTLKVGSKSFNCLDAEEQMQLSLDELPNLQKAVNQN